MLATFLLPLTSIPASAGPKVVAELPQADLLPRFLQGPMAGVEEIVFAVRGLGGDGHWYANFGYHVQNPNSMQYGPPGGRLCRLNLRTGKLTVLLDDPKGGVRDPVVHYDGGKILFSYRKGDSHPRNFHLYEINADGTGLRQVTNGAYDEIEPIYLPDGDLLFCSSRCNRWVQCWFTQVAVLHRSDANGQNVRLLSANVEQDNTPWMMPDGRLLYMRWEYVDRSRVEFHHLWTVNPDGTGQMTFYGNMHSGTVMLDAKPIPGGDKVVASFSPGHGQKEHAGWVTIVDPDAGPDEKPFARTVSWSADYRDPSPFSEDCFLVAQDRRILVMDGQGRTQTIYELPRGSPMAVHEPRPLAPRPREPIITDRTDPAKATGTLILSDVTYGRNMTGVKPGEIRKLLVLETLPKPVNFSGEMEPLSLGGTFTLPRILGTVPVEPDGSAYLEVPALRPIFFVALDANDLSVKRMQSFVSVMPGETTGCSGCHEQRNRTAPLKGVLMATRRPPSRIEPIRDVPDVIDFPRDVQPILDRHCVKCHNTRTFANRMSLEGDRGPTYSHSYVNLMWRNLVSHGRDAQGNRPPRSLGSSASPLMQRILSGRGAKLSDKEITTIRLWIESGAPYPGTYAALGTGMVPCDLDADVMSRRCRSCHAVEDPRKKDEAFKTHRELLFNLTRPGKSLVLLAPLAKEAGGLALCSPKTATNPPPAAGAGSPVFASTDDADYRKLLAGIEKAKRNLDTHKRFDMPDFRPNVHYIREMKRFGILPESLGPNDPVDPYATDQAYWRSFWYTPPRQTSK